MSDASILSWIPGELLAPTRHELPRAQPDGPDAQCVVIPLPDGGRAGLTYLKVKTK